MATAHPETNFYGTFINTIGTQFPLFKDIQFPVNFISEGKSTLTQCERNVIQTFIQIMDKCRNNSC